MYAIVKSGGKQYRVSKGSVICVELLDAQDDGKITFNEVLFVGNSADKSEIGGPFLGSYQVLGEIESEVLGPKVLAFKYTQRKNYHRNKGHRQKYCRVKITDIQAVA